MQTFIVRVDLPDNWQELDVATAIQRGLVAHYKAVSRVFIKKMGKKRAAVAMWPLERPTDGNGTLRADAQLKVLMQEPLGGPARN